MTRLIYILSASHSGSTLLTLLLGAHPNITTVGELKANKLGRIDKYRCSCGELIGECSFWKKVSQTMLQHGEAFDVANFGTNFSDVESKYANYLLQPLVRGFTLEKLRDFALTLSKTWRKKYRQISERNLKLIKVLCELTHNDVIVDSSKIGIRLKYLLKIPELDVRVIRLIRDGRAVAMTYTDPAEFADAKKAELRNGGGGGDRASEKLSIRQASREWRRSNEEADAILKKMPENKWIQVSYESICRDPKTSLRRIFDFIGVATVYTDENFWKVTQHIIGNGMRLDEAPKIQIDQRWKKILTPKDLKLFDEQAGKLNLQFGYHSK